MSHDVTYDTKILKVDPSSIKFQPDEELPIITDERTKKNLENAARIISSTSQAIGFPTETVYGLGANALNDESVKSIYRAKNRPSDNPLIVHVSSLNQLKRLLLPPDYEIPSIYQKLLAKYTPGPISFLLPIFPSTPISNLVTANQKTFAVRIPANPVARALIALSDTPLAAPSANASTRPSPTLASHVYNDLNGKISLILDGGPCDVGVESSVIDGLVQPPMLLRPGGVSVEDIKKFGGEEWKNVQLGKASAGKDENVRTPGMKYKHYSPKAKVVLFVRCGDGVSFVRNFLEDLSEEEEEQPYKKIALLKSKLFKSGNEISGSITIDRDLGVNGSDISRNLFKLLREVDELGVDLILVEGVDEANEGLAIMNRLGKAAFQTIDGGL